MKLVEEIPLSNGLVAEIWDQSRAISADTTKVAMLVRIKVMLKPEYFPTREQFNLTARILGPDVYYEMRKERTFVSNREVWNAFKGFVEEFKRDTLPYVSRDKFPAGLARSKYLDIEKNPYKYGLPIRKA